MTLGAALFVLAVAGAVWVYQSPFLTIEQIVVEGAAALDPARVVSVAGIAEDETLLRLDVAAVEDRLRADPWIQDVTIRRSLPDAVTISIVERTPVALVDAGPQGYWLIDEDALLLEQRSLEETTTLPVVRDVTLTEPAAGNTVDDDVVRNALAVIEGLSDQMLALTRTISAPAIDRTAIITHGDVEIFVGSADDISTKETLALRILQEQGDGVVSINVRSVDRPTWRGLDAGQ